MGGLTGVLTLIHILFATAWLGGAILLIVFDFATANADTQTKIALKKMGVMAGRVFATFAVVALAAGTWLVIRVEYFGFDQAWISIGFLAIAVGAVLGPAFFVPQSKAMVAELEAGDPAVEARHRRYLLVAVLEATLLVVTVWAMVYKPGA